MNETRPRNWYYIFSYLMISIVTLGILFFITEWFFPETSAELIPKNDALSARFFNTSRWANRVPASRKKTPTDLNVEKIMLTLDQENEFTNSKIVYRGLDENSRLKIDVVILDLDPEAYYPYRIHTDKAKSGFRLAGQNFKLVSARESVIRILHYKK